MYVPSLGLAAGAMNSFGSLQPLFMVFLRAAKSEGFGRSLFQ